MIVKYLLNLINVSLTDSNGALLGNNFIIFFTAPNLNVTNEDQLILYSNCGFDDGENTISVNQDTNYYILVNRVDANKKSNINISIPNPLPQVEKNALLDLYNNTQGDNWTNNTNWDFNRFVDDNWKGIKTQNINGTLHVIGIFLNSNSLKGTILESLGDVSELKELQLDDNFLTGSFPNLTSLSLTHLWIEYNLFHFADFENEFSAYLNNTNFKYSPMKKVGDEKIYDLSIGDSYTFTMPPVRGTDVTMYSDLNSGDVNGFVKMGAKYADVVVKGNSNADEQFGDIIKELEATKPVQTIPQSDEFTETYHTLYQEMLEAAKQD